MILWRHIIKAHIGPFLFSNGIIIFLFLLQFLMKRAGDLVGKGLQPLVIIELISLNLAWMVVLSVPMSVLVATLMAFGKLSSDNEVVIMRASGMSLYRMMLPPFLVTALLTYGLYYFNDRILPEANIRLQVLLTDIVRMKPTLTIQSGVFTSDEDIPSYRILAKKTFERSSDLQDVTIYDLSRPDKNVVVTAHRGKVNFSSDFTEILMDLFDGEIHEIDNTDYRSYRKIRFTRHRVAIPASGFGFQRSDAKKARRDDRTMSSAMMQAIVDSIKKQEQSKIVSLNQKIRDNYLALQQRYFFPVPAYRPAISGFRSAPIVPSPVPDSKRITAKDSLDILIRTVSDLHQMRANLQSDLAAIEFDQKQADKFLVEIYKKTSIPFACMVFIFVGIPLGMIARRGGFGVGTGLSLGFFLFYWICLIGGEKLADRDVLTPFWGMWIANFVLGVCGILLTTKTARETTVIDWSALARWIPRRFRRDLPDETMQHSSES